MLLLLLRKGSERSAENEESSVVSTAKTLSGVSVQQHRGYFEGVKLTPWWLQAIVDCLRGYGGRLSSSRTVATGKPSFARLVACDKLIPLMVQVVLLFA